MSVTTVSSKSKTTASKKSAQAKMGPSEDDIRILAYSLYERRSADGLDGDATTDWVEAERLLQEE